MKQKDILTKVKLYLRVVRTPETKELFYYKVSSKKPVVVINGNEHIFYHTSSEILNVLKEMKCVDIRDTLISHWTKKSPQFGIEYDTLQMTKDGNKYIVLRIGGKSKIDAWTKAIDLSKKMSEKYGISLEACEKDLIE